MYLTESEHVMRTNPQFLVGAQKAVAPFSSFVISIGAQSKFALRELLWVESAV